MPHAVKHMSLPAFLEQTAEECIECANALCAFDLLSRKSYQPTANFVALSDAVTEELTDLVICLNELAQVGITPNRQSVAEMTAKLEGTKAIMPDVLELAATRILEAGHLCLKYARALRKENPVSKKYAFPAIDLMLSDALTKVSVAIYMLNTVSIHYDEDLYEMKVKALEERFK